MKKIKLHTEEAIAAMYATPFFDGVTFQNKNSNKIVLQSLADNIEIESESPHGSWGIYNVNGKKLPLQYVHYEGSNYVGLRSFEKEKILNEKSLTFEEWVAWEYAQNIFRDYMEYERLR